MLQATIKTQYLREMIDAIAAVVTEFRLHVQEDGIRMAAVNSQNVAMVSVILKKDAFESFTATPGEMGLDVPKVKAILASLPDALVDLKAAGNDEIQFDYTAPGTDWFDSHQYIMKTLVMASIRSDPNPPTLALDATLTVPSDSLLAALTTVHHHTEKVVLILNKDDQTFSISGSEDDVIKVRIQGPVSPVEVTARSLFSLDLLLDAVKAIPKGETVIIAFAEDHPVKLTYNIANGHGEVMYLQAPRIETM
jgi:proliferating cell nuclear antigen